MKQENISYWQNTFQHSQKLEFYRSSKTDHTSSSYLDLTRGTAGGRALVKLRISNHKLMIEIGRYNQTTMDNRHCPFCGCNVMEDEVHFLFHCPAYSMIRNKCYYKGLCNNYQEGGGGEKLEGGALHKIAAKIEGAQSEITHLTEEGP